MSPIELAIKDLNSQEVPYIAETAEKYRVKRSTLSRRWRGKTVSREDYRENKSLLNNQQQEALITEINRLSAFGTPPTVAIVRVFAFNLAGIPSHPCCSGFLVGYCILGTSEQATINIRGVFKAG